MISPSLNKDNETGCSLFQISDGLGVENLRAMKNLCYDIIPKAQLDATDTGLDVFNALIEKSKSCSQTDSLSTYLSGVLLYCYIIILTVIALIDANKVAFLCELLDEIGRKDLTDEVKAYIEMTEGWPCEDKYSVYSQTVLRSKPKHVKVAG